MREKNIKKMTVHSRGKGGVPMERGIERHMFPGNNTSVGFYSCFRYILPQEDASHIFCLKGGPGTGKSTLMKSIGSRMQNAGFDVDYFHCSSDPDSLDAILVLKLRVAVIDGTAPHVIDPVNPGAVDEIVNLGEYWDQNGIKQYKDEIIKVNKQTGRLFQRAYRYLAAAKSISGDIDETINAATDKMGEYVEAERLIEKLFADCPSATVMGKTIKRFASAITPLGIVQYLDTLYDGSYHSSLIKNVRGAGVSAMLDRVAKKARLHGFDTELYYCPMSPEEKIEHLIIPERKRAFISESDYYATGRTYHEVIDLARYTDMAVVAKDQQAYEFNLKSYETLLGEAVTTLYQAKSEHDEMEKYYVANMDFDREKEKGEEIVRRILSYV